MNNSSQMIDIDKSSEYTLQTGTNIDILIKEKSRFSSLLMGILLGSCALFYFLYKKIKLKEILSKLSQLCKQTPEFLKNILSYIGIEFEDVFEEYDDANRLLLKLVKRQNNWIYLYTQLINEINIFIKISEIISLKRYFLQHNKYLKKEKNKINKNICSILLKI